MPLTFGQLLSGYIAWLQVRPSAARYRQIYQSYFLKSHLHDRPADAITRNDVLLIKQTYAHTPAQCSKALGCIKQAYNWGMDQIDPATNQPIYTGQNPAWRVTKHDYIPRERLMDLSEIRVILAGLEFLSLKYQAFLVVRLLTPSRIKEICGMRRDAVNLETGKWLKRFTKNKRPQYVLIPRQALAYLRQLPIEGDYFFMGAYGHSLHPEAPRKIWSRFCKDLGLQDLQLLDFRRTLASYLYTEIKADDLTAKAVLNHYDGRPVAIYTRLNYDQLAPIVQAYADWIWRLAPQGMIPDSQVPPHSIDPDGHHRLSNRDSADHLLQTRADRIVGCL